MKKIAHAKQNLQTGHWEEPHLLAEHLLGTAELASKFAEEFSNSDWGLAAGLLHDLGKGSEEFQEYIRAKSGYDTNDSIAKKTSRVNHSTHGADWTYQNWSDFGLGKIIAYLIAGHHAGLPDWAHEIGTGGNLADRLKKDEIAKLPFLKKSFVNEITFPVIKPASYPCSTQLDDEHIHLWIRMLYSCLVDADFLDTERYMTGTNYEKRGQQSSIEDLKKMLDDHMLQFDVESNETVVNSVRKQVLIQCRFAAVKKPGLFTLTVPTGGGKTLSSMAFALEHALIHHKQRIIVVIPYTSIIEQTAKVYKNILGENNVIEHHSSLDPDNETPASRLATENWDAPVIVTTNVQFFESLFAARSSACRKLHNITSSIVIIDEVQMLPTDYLKPILQVIKGLTDNFNVSMVLCTATQPAITGKVGKEDAQFSVLEKENCHEIMQSPSPDKLTELLQRVEVHQAGKFGEWQELSKELLQFEQVLCIVNTRKDCSELFALLPQDTVHLSANMCGEHRSKVIAEIKNRLKKKESIRVVSTQLVEAGVDIDFPVVYRAMAGFDSIAQAAGRCNREGNLKNSIGEHEKGRMVVFDPPKPAPAGSLRKGEQAGKIILATDPDGCKNLRPSTFHKYFELYFGDLNTFDKHNMHDLLVKDANPDLNFQFRTAAHKFNLIDNQKQVSIVVKYNGEKNDSTTLMESLIKFGPNRTLMRKLQRFTISIPEQVFAEVKGSFEEIRGIWWQYADILYDDTLGFVGYNGDIPIL